ncbi:hypothetical protein [Floridanema evergladense]|uniref:Uncharacterized protein n=1 Tax=Floridaenema evergladense BLCC-F167 TaxID=3153639 RepID=A0ABV4WH93_9CYAN
MIRSLVKSAFQTGCLSVASEGLIGQVLAYKGYQSADLDALSSLYYAVNSGQIEREARGAVTRTLIEYVQPSLEDTHLTNISNWGSVVYS